MLSTYKINVDYHHLLFPCYYPPFMCLPINIWDKNIIHILDMLACNFKMSGLIATYDNILN